MNVSEKMKADWDQRAHHHARFWIATETYRTEEAFDRSGQVTAQALLTTLQGREQRGWKLLEVGCGIGRILKPLAPHFSELIGVDVSSRMIAQSKKWLRGYSHIQTFENSGVDLHQFPNDHFELVYSYVAFQHMPRLVFQHYLGEVNRVLKPQGYLAFQLPIGPYLDVPPEDTVGIRSYPLEEVRKKLHEQGLAFITHPEAQENSPTSTVGMDHRFYLAQKIREGAGKTSPKFVELEYPSRPSSLETHMYIAYAKNCLRDGDYSEVIKTLQILLKQNPNNLVLWLRVTNLQLKSGDYQNALMTLRQLTSLHPNFQEGQQAFQQLLKLMTPVHSAFPALNQPSVTSQEKELVFP